MCGRQTTAPFRKQEIQNAREREFCFFFSLLRERELLKVMELLSSCLLHSLGYNLRGYFKV